MLAAIEKKEGVEYGFLSFAFY